MNWVSLYRLINRCSISTQVYSFDFVCWVLWVPSDCLISIQLQFWLFCCWACGCCWPVTKCVKQSQSKKLKLSRRKRVLQKLFLCSQIVLFLGSKQLFLSLKQGLKKLFKCLHAELNKFYFEKLSPNFSFSWAMVFILDLHRSPTRRKYQNCQIKLNIEKQS